jgi:hypothetical protein
MRTLAIGILLILIFSKNIYSQQENDEFMFSPYWDIYGNNYLNGVNSGKGNTGIATENGISCASLNPASFSQKNKFDLNLQYTVKTIQPWNEPYYASSEMEIRQNWYFSVSVGLGYKVNKNLQVGLVYSNPLSYLFYYGTEPLNDPHYPGDSVDNYNRVHVHQISVPISYSTGKFSFGLNLTYGFYIDQYHGLITTIEMPDGYEGDITARFNRFNVQAGAIFKPNDYLSIGATFTPGSKSAVHEENPNTLPAYNSIVYVSKLPWHAGIGFEYKFPNSNIKLSGDYKYENTSIVTGFKDRFNLNLGAEFVLDKKFTLRTGFFTLMDDRTTTAYPNPYVPVSNHTQYFLTLGGTINFKNADLTASLLDSHISPGTIKNTYFNTSFSYHF